MDVLQSRQFAGRIVDELNLVKDPTFNPHASGGEVSRRFSDDIFLYPKNVLGIGTSSKASRIVPDAKEQRDRAISMLLSQFDVSRTGESLAVRITVTNSRPWLAVTIANTIAKLYVESSLEFKQDERTADTQRALNTGGAVAFLRQSTTQPLLITLRNEEARLLQNKAELGARFGKNHPQMVEAESQIAGVRRMIGDEVQRILSDLEAESLKPSARIVSMAATPNSPSFPRPGIIIPAAFTSSTFLALLLALMLETTDSRIRTGQRITELLHLPNLGYVPKRSTHSSCPGRQFVLHKGANCLTFAEAERSVYMACRYSETKQAHRVLMITSCHPNAANASTAWGIATAAAADGRPTILLNLDLQDTDVSRSTEQFDRYLRNEALLPEIIQTIPGLPEFGFIEATPAMSQQSMSLDANSMGEMMAGLKQSGYDLIVLNASPVLTTGDANWLSPFVDGVVLIATWGTTTEEQLLDAVAQLRLNHANLIGVVVNQVIPKVHARYHNGGFVKTAQRVRDPVWRNGAVYDWKGNTARPDAPTATSAARVPQSPVDA
jgi:Mrp family chromosome partitioning ATPase/capsular polysaccharide biosynthesis protein